MRMLAPLVLSLCLYGCSPVWTAEVDALLNAGAPHFASRIKNSTQDYRRDLAEVILGPVEMSAEWSKRFDDALLEIGRSRGNEKYACTPDPGVRVRIQDGVEFADVLLCFECWTLHIENEQGDIVVEMTPFDSKKVELADLVIEAFPSDKELAKFVKRK
ncbi:MAG: hypothetical protein M3R13_05255 [Armatimonadota bacterium]|nr:hypothetical protein [Armatimonadota bacterium]